MKPPYLTFYGGRGHTATNFPTSFWTWIKSLRIQLQEKSPAFDIIDAIKFERTQIHFFTDVFTAVSSSLLKVPNERKRTGPRIEPWGSPALNTSLSLSCVPVLHKTWNKVLLRPIRVTKAKNVQIKNAWCTCKPICLFAVLVPSLSSLLAPFWRRRRNIARLDWKGIPDVGLASSNTVG